MTQHQHVCSESQQSQQTQAARLATRMQREIKLLQSDPPPGVCAWPSDDQLLTLLEAQIEGPEGTVYAKGLFKIQVQVPERYPFEPPNVRFVTPVYHPNIDSGGRICLDILNLPPKGAWRPSLNIATVLASIGLLLAEPNADDGLMGDISAEYKHNRPSFDQKARLWTQKHAMQMECQIKTLPLKISSADSSSLSGQVSNERIDHLKQIKETAVESVRGSQNQTNSMGELKDSCLPVKSTKTVSKRLSLAKEPLLQPTIGHSEGTVNDAYTKIYKENINLQPALCVDMDVKQNIPNPSFPEINSSRCKLHHEVGISNSSSFSGDTSKEQGKSVLKGVVMAKENLQPMSCNSEKPPKLSIPKLLDCETGMEMRESTKTLTLQNGIAGNSNQRIASLPSNYNLQHCELHEQKAARLRKYKLPISGPLQPEDVNKKNMEAINQMETVIVSDSESDEELVEVSRSRLSLSQRTLTRKRKFGSNAR